MFALQCPKCGSSRVHRGYNRPSFFKRMIGRKSLLCNNCNLLFEGFARESDLEKAKHRRRKRWTPPEESATAASRSPFDLRPNGDVLQRVQQAQANDEAFDPGIEDELEEELSAPPDVPPPAAAPLAVAGLTPPHKIARAAAQPVITNDDNKSEINANDSAPEVMTNASVLTAATGESPASESSSSNSAEEEDDNEMPATAHETEEAQRRAAARAALAHARVVASKSQSSDSGEFVAPSQLTPAPDLQPTNWDYFNFAKYYARLRLKSLFRMHSSSHPMDIKFRWRNWWHWQRRKRTGI